MLQFVPAHSFLFFYLYVLPIYPLSFLFISVRAMTPYSSDVINVVDDAGTATINMASGSVPGADDLCFPLPLVVAEYISRYKKSKDAWRSSTLPPVMG